ncbi:DUF2651 family protein [Bacillus salacetis]|nr:DUF2651 family protein [Bacillus salacetis]
MIGTVFLLLYVFMPILVIIISIAGTKTSRSAFSVSLTVLVLLLILQVTNIFQAGYLPIIIYSLISLAAGLMTRTADRRRTRTSS